MVTDFYRCAEAGTAPGPTVVPPGIPHGWGRVPV